MGLGEQISTRFLTLFDIGGPDAGVTHHIELDHIELDKLGQI